jgi:hypothetical protein
VTRSSRAGRDRCYLHRSPSHSLTAERRQQVGAASAWASRRSYRLAGDRPACPLECFDGTRAPGAVMASRVEVGLDVVALTDHDSTDGWAERAWAATVWRWCPMEISAARRRASAHLLCYQDDSGTPGCWRKSSGWARPSPGLRMVSLLAEDYRRAGTMSSTMWRRSHPGPAAHRRRARGRGRGRRPH